MSASLTLDKSGLDNFIARLEDPVIKQELEKLPQNRAVIAIVAQAIADNFTQEGPGWAPLSPNTIRGSVSEKKYKELSKMTDAELLKHEQKVRKGKTDEEPHRSILRRTGLLMKSVTTPGAKGNIWKTEGHRLIWGTDLVYAGIHNHGGVIKPKNAKMLHWSNRTGDHFAKQVTIPKREFLVIRNQWMKVLNEKLLEITTRIIKSRLAGAT